MGSLFEREFLRTVSLCAEHDLLDGTHLSVDGFHAEADAALKSLRASLALVAAPEPGAEQRPPACEPEPADAPPQLSLAEPRSGPTPKPRSSNQTAVSRTDPDAKLRGKPGQRPHLVHRGQVGVDPKARCVVACLGEQADGYEGDGLAPVLDRARFACPELASVGADQGSPGHAAAAHRSSTPNCCSAAPRSTSNGSRARPHARPAASQQCPQPVASPLVVYEPDEVFLRRGCGARAVGERGATAAGSG